MSASVQPGDVVRIRRGRMRATPAVPLDTDVSGMKVVVADRPKRCDPTGTGEKDRVFVRPVREDGTVDRRSIALDVPVDDLKPTVMGRVRGAARSVARKSFGGVDLPWVKKRCRIHHQHEPGVCEGY